MTISFVYSHLQRGQSQKKMHEQMIIQTNEQIYKHTNVQTRHPYTKFVNKENRMKSVIISSSQVTTSISTPKLERVPSPEFFCLTFIFGGSGRPFLLLPVVAGVRHRRRR